MKIKEIIKHEKAPMIVVMALTVFNFAFAARLIPVELAGVLTILGIGFVVFSKTLK